MDTSIEFDKYKKKGPYHWKDFKRNSAYRQNALFIKDWVRPGQTLDIGAGDGLITSLLPDTLGIDNNQLAVYYANDKGVPVKFGEAYYLPFPDNYFDNVLMADVIEHLKHDVVAIMEARRVLSHGGFFYVVTPPATREKEKYHYREFTPDQLEELMMRCGVPLVGEIFVRKELNRMYGVFKKTSP